MGGEAWVTVCGGEGTGWAGRRMGRLRRRRAGRTRGEHGGCRPGQVWRGQLGAASGQPPSPAPVLALGMNSVRI